MSAKPPFLDDASIPADLEVEFVRCAVCGVDDADVAARGYDYEYRTSRREWTYVRCRRCGLVYANPRPSVRELPRIYPPHYYSFDEAKRTRPLVARLRRRLEAGKVRRFHRFAGDGPRRVLDIGCGDGRFLSVLREHGPADWTLCGIDIDERAVERARAKGFDARFARIEDFDPAGERFHLVVLFQVLEHVSDPRGVCRKIRGLLEPGGLLVVETPETAGLDERLFRSGLWGGYHIPRHWNLFNPGNLGRLLGEEGFEVLAREPLLSTSFWINSLYNYLLVRGAGERTLAFFHYQNPLLLGCFLLLDRARILLGGRTSNQRVVARRICPG